jgi:hypothetical protein
MAWMFLSVVLLLAVYHRGFRHFLYWAVPITAFLILL